MHFDLPKGSFCPFLLVSTFQKVSSMVLAESSNGNSVISHLFNYRLLFFPWCHFRLNFCTCTPFHILPLSLFFHWSLKKKFKYYLLFFGNLNLFLLFVLFSFRYSCDPSFFLLFLFFLIYFYWSRVDLQALLVAQLVKNLPAMWETWVWSLGWGRIWLQCRRPEFVTWVGKILWGRERLPTPVFWSREIHGLYSPWDRKESDMTQWLSLSLSELT